MNRGILLFLLLSAVLSCNKMPDKTDRYRAPFFGVEAERVDSLLSTMSLDEKIGQLLLVETGFSGRTQDSTLLEMSRKGLIGGIVLQKMPLEKLITFQSLNRNNPIPLYFGTKVENSLAELFATNDFPSGETIRSIQNDSIITELHEKFARECKKAGINIAILSDLNIDELFFAKDSISINNRSMTYINRAADKVEKLNKNGILPIQNIRFDIAGKMQDTSSLFSKISQLKQWFFNFGYSGARIDAGWFADSFLSHIPENFSQIEKKKLSFNGLVITDFTADSLRKKTGLENVLNATDIFLTDNAPDFFNFLKDQYEKGNISTNSLNHKVKKILLSKSWMDDGLFPKKPDKSSHPVLVRNQLPPVGSKNNITSPSTLKVLPRFTGKSPHTPVDSMPTLRPDYYDDKKMAVYNYLLFKESITLAKNTGNIIPLSINKNFKIFEIGKRKSYSFLNYFSKYSGYRSQAILPDTNGNIPAIPVKKYTNTTILIVLNDIELDPFYHIDFLKSIKEQSKLNDIVLVNFGKLGNLSFLDYLPAITQIFQKNSITEALTAQMLFGGIQAKGQIPAFVSGRILQGQKNIIPVNRLAYGIPEELGISSDYLKRLDYIINDGISQRAFPGCQLLIAKEGNVFFSKAYGHFTYDNRIEVQENNLYDLASISKVMGTTLAVMKQFDEGKFKLGNEIGSLIGLEDDATVGGILVNQLLIHQSGLRSNAPIAKYVFCHSRKYGHCRNYFSRTQDIDYPIPVTKSFFMRSAVRDSIWKAIFRMPVKPHPRYKYSDVNFLLLQKLVETKAGQNLDFYLESNFYNPLGLRHTTYRPAERFDISEIPPTEYDRRWRKQQIQGYVHDETAAVLGGVAGNAGLFSTTNDLVVILQMLLNGGHYGGQRYLSQKTVNLFTSAGHGNHRGLGFDKPNKITKKPSFATSASPASYGHTGYTGGVFWVDPEKDLIFIFLTNRVYPTRRRTKLYKNKYRKRLHQVIYDALNTFEGV